MNASTIGTCTAVTKQKTDTSPSTSTSTRRDDDDDGVICCCCCFIVSTGGYSVAFSICNNLLCVLYSKKNVSILCPTPSRLARCNFQLPMSEKTKKCFADVQVRK